MDHSKSLHKLYKFVMEAGTKLEIKFTTTAASIIYLHKFLSVVPEAVLSSEDYHTAAAACVYLAGKVEEDTLRIRDVINVFHRMLHRDEPPLNVDEHYWHLRDGLGRLEILILRYLNFRLRLEHPHKYLFHYLKTLEAWIPRDVCHQKLCSRTALSLLNGCYVEPEFVLSQKPQKMAAAVFYLTLKIYGISVPSSDAGDKKPWWQILADVKHEELLNTASKILKIVDSER